MAGLSSLGAPGSPGAGSHDSGDDMSPESGVREQDRFLPVANISRIMKKALPGTAKIAKDAKEMVQECVSEFISFVTNEASDKCRREKRKTINGDDLLWAMAFLGFEDYIEPLKLYLAVQRVMASRSAHMSKKMLDNDETAKLPRPSGRGIRIIEPNEPLPSRAAPALSPAAPAPSSRQTAPVGPNPRMQKRPRINSSAVASSSTGPNFVAPGPGSYDTSEEAGMTEVLNKLESLLQSDFMELNIHKRPPIDLDSIPLNFQPRVYEDSSILLDKTGDVAMELYSHSMLPRDKTMLLKHAHPWIEKEAASLLCQLSLCVHQLSMTCSHYKHECTKIKQRLKDYKSSVAVEVLTIQEDRKRFEAEHAKHQSVIDQIKAQKLKHIQLQGEINKLRVDNLERKKQLTLARNCLDSEKRRSYELGSQDGVRMYLASPQFQTRLKDVTFDARRTAIRDFLKSKQLYDLMMSNAVNDQLDGFYKAIDYLKKDGLLNPDFNTDEFEAEYKGKDLVRPSFTLDEREEFTDFPEFRIIMERHFQQTQAS